MTASAAPYHIIDDDDDEFDWEAAVREIDVACQTTKPFTSTSASCSTKFAPSVHLSVSDIPITSDIKKNFPKPSRQSTLDNFVAKKDPLPPPPAPPNTTSKGLEAEDWNFREDGESFGCIGIDAEAAKTWIYPVNVPLRDYQLAITKSALFSNTLVALPTGLGKTLIAAVVMYNYFRWFPNGKIVFAAPSRPLVMQQIEACHNIVGIPQKWTIDMTGQLNPKNRAIFWKTKRVFFVTPQVLENDIHSGICLAKYLVCLVIDEAHRAMGNYSYCAAVRELMSIPVQLRILALTATPGSKQQTIQQVIDNLKISVLEYRSESDHDVNPYVHDRKLELVQVAMGREAVEIDYKILQVIRPMTARLSAIGVLQNRDYNTLSPCELLKIREKFRETPPPDLPHVKCGEVEGYFGVLISLYYIRKILSSHGIRPAYEMLEDKLSQGAFARFMSKNGDIWNAKLLMQQSLSHGASSPKLSKMSEVLLEHFKNNDPKSSRVIIFSNYRGSVRDIMDALKGLGESIRAAQFIGQSSGKAMKGQSQKIQQAVLEKFRSGGYNIIVATSIGEEGLDIMEVDLVICFDANISPLRMIQRMGRTGRKHDGRVVLACEGPELKGYLRKQAKSKTVRKHMRNGGTNSFNFHLSPRMVPHVFKPDVQFVELTIEQFIPRGKQVKEDRDFEVPAFRDKLSVAETNVVERYFLRTGGNARKPSLIAFPYYQTFPSRVHTVSHSNRTMMLIDAMQILQRPLFSDLKASSSEAEKQLETGNEVNVIDENQSGKGIHSSSPTPMGIHLQEHVDPDVDGKELKSQFVLRGILRGGYEQSKACVDCPSLPAHSFLFCADFVSINENGKVLISAAPLLKLNEKLHSSGARGSSGVLPLERIMLSRNAGQERHSPAKCITNCTSLSFGLHNLYERKEKTCAGEDVPSNQVMASEMRDPLGNKAVDVCTDEMKNSELSPRLTNFLKTGVVPESPDDRGQSRTSFLIPDCASPFHLRDNIIGKSTSYGDHKEIITDHKFSQDNVCSPINDETKTPLRVKNCANIRRRILISPSTEEGHTLLVNATDHSFSEDSHISSGEKDDSIKPMHKLIRLHKAGSYGNGTNQRGKRDFVSTRKNSISCTSSDRTRNKRGRGKVKLSNDVYVRDFIDEEVEVSSDADVSDDEDAEDEQNSYDSFIDDRINPTAMTSQAEARMDMMNVYRRSLLSQSPLERSQSSTTPELASTSKISEHGSSSIKMSDSVQNDQIPSEVVPCFGSEASHDKEAEIGIKKRKLSLCHSESLPKVNLETVFALQSSKEPLHDNANEGAFSDDFYDGIDLDAIEAQAALLLQQKSNSTTQTQSCPLNVNNVDSPSFDLGI